MSTNFADLPTSIDLAYTPERDAFEYPGPNVGGSFLLIGEKVLPLTPSPDYRVDYFLVSHDR